MAIEILKKDNIILNAQVADRWEGIRLSGQILVQNGYVTEEYIDDMLERERSSSVYIGNHVAIPHGLADSKKKVLTSGISFVQVPKGVSFGDEVAYMFIGIAGKEDEHVEILSRIATACMDLDAVEKLRTTKDKDEVIRILSGDNQ